jgi:hypothetical protein
MSKITPKMMREVFTDDVLNVLPNNSTINKGVANHINASNPEWQHAQKEGINRVAKTEEWKQNQKQGCAEIRSKGTWNENVRKAVRESELKSRAKRIEKCKETMATQEWLDANKQRCIERYDNEENYTVCPHCNEKVDNANYTRWHGDNCKLNPNGPRYKDPNKPKVRKKIETVTCPHCGKVGQKSIMTYHHFDNCKLNPANKQV